jgi:hypothetical protein
MFFRQARISGALAKQRPNVRPIDSKATRFERAMKLSWREAAPRFRFRRPGARDNIFDKFYSFNAWRPRHRMFISYAAS